MIIYIIYIQKVTIYSFLNTKAVIATNEEYMKMNRLSCPLPVYRYVVRSGFIRRSGTILSDRDKEETSSYQQKEFIVHLVRSCFVQGSHDQLTS